MNKSPIVFIINPNSGSGKHDLEDEIFKYSQKYKYPAIIEYTKAKNHAIEIVNKYLAKNFKHFVAVGGDGTVNEIASQLLNKEVKLSIVPKGSGNGLARMLKTPMNAKKAIERVFISKSKYIDNGFVNDIPFFCTAGIGYDAFCADEYNKTKHNRGFWNYIKIVFQCLFKYKPININLNGQDHSVFSMTFANANQFGNNAFIAPDAIIDDGYLDCTIIAKHPKIYDLILGIQLMTKKIRSSKYVSYFRGHHFEVSADSDILMHLDGEPLKLHTNKVEISIATKTLLVGI